MGLPKNKALEVDGLYSVWDLMEGENDSPNNGVLGNVSLCSGDSVVDLTNEVHQLPCCIKQTGPSSVSHYFKPKETGVNVDGLSVKEACFRGRKLQGATISLPEGYKGFVLEKKINKGKRKATGNSEENNCWQTRAKFQNLTYWNHDTLPSNGDAFLRCFHWFSVADVLHKPVSADDLASVSTIPMQ
ncbi:hypothetical protein GIB67_012615 [Kingdonia uniflora]|uniref:Uncharacterized protein n=1 Tax=Kingdonia uniflora TaxID=39325 RepID=A0A7J7NFS2_9MAGN|nr:hypothetical protein GIB67_012615 [Kingdonia uniflora]